MGAFQGELKDFAAAELGAVAIRAAVERAGIKPEDVEEVIMGCVLPAGQGQAPARQASLGGGLPLATGCTTVNKMCGSGMKAAMLANDLLLAGSNAIMVAGGMESMTNAPYLLPKARAGYPDGASAGVGSHVPGRPRRRLRQGAPDGQLRRGLRVQVRLHAGRAGQLRHRLAGAGPESQQRGLVCLGDRTCRR